MMSSVNNCYHCNSDCVQDIIYDEKHFCCEGCKTVYDILNINQMNTYYRLNERPGVKAERKTAGKYNFLELDDIQEKILQFKEQEISRVKLFLPQIHCSSCLWLLERLHKFHPGVVQSQVYFNDKEAEITFNHNKISLKELAELLSAVGYPPEISLEHYDAPKIKKRNNALIIKIGVIGFCFGNIMLMSFPEYTGIDKSFKNFQNTFNYLNILFSIPVLLYGAKDYFISSFKAVRAKSVNIDVPITLGILALYFRSIYEILSGVGAGYLDSFAGLIFFLLIGKWFQEKTYSAINFERDYRSYFPIATSRKRDGEEEVVALKNIEVGDRLVIRNNEIIPADAILLNGQGRIDYSFVSGESELISKKSGDRLFAGGRQVGASLEIEVVREIENSYLTRLWNNPIFHAKKEGKKLSDNISKYFTIAIIVIAIVAGFVWANIDPDKAPFVITSVLIVACPCAIALSVPFTYGNLLRIFSKRSFYLRSADVVEPINDITDIVFDKTGTLTISDQSNVHWEGAELGADDKGLIHDIVDQSSHPLSRSIANYLSGDYSNQEISIEEIPGKGIVANVDGCEWKIGSGKWLNAFSTSKNSQVHIVKDGEYLGCFNFQNVYRAQMDELVDGLGRSFNIHLLSGDNDAEYERLKELFGDKVSMKFDQSPEDKLVYIADLQAKGKKVMMLGDGLNDAGALKQADVGVAVADDVYAFTPSSDAIIDGKNLTRIGRFIHFTSFGIKVVWLSYAFSLMYNLVGMYFALSGQLTPLVAAILMPLSSISVVLLVTLITNIQGRKLN